MGEWYKAVDLHGGSLAFQGCSNNDSSTINRRFWHADTGIFGSASACTVQARLILLHDTTSNR